MSSSTGQAHATFRDDRSSLSGALSEKFAPTDVGGYGLGRRSLRTLVSALALAAAVALPAPRAGAALYDTIYENDGQPQDFGGGNLGWTYIV